MELLAGFGYAVETCHIPVPTLIVSAGRGRGTVYLCGRLSEAQRVVALARTVAHLWPCRRKRDDLTADLFALLLGIPYAVRIEGATAQVARLSDIGSRQDLFSGGSLSGLLRLLDGVLAVLDPRKAPLDATTLCDHARDLYEDGKRLRLRKHFSAADAALAEASRLAREGGDFELALRAILSRAAASRQRGCYPEARRYIGRALRLARRHELRDLYAEARHDEMVLETEVGNDERALEASRQALDAYRINHPRLAAFAHDRAYLWMSNGYFGMAYPILHATALMIDGASDEAVSAWANVARAAAGMGDSHRFREAATCVEFQIGDSSCCADALVELARGAGSLGLWDMACEYAERAYATALQTHERRLEVVAVSILESIENDRVALQRRDRTPPRRHADFAVEVLARINYARDRTRGIVGLATEPIAAAQLPAVAAR